MINFGWLINYFTKIIHKVSSSTDSVWILILEQNEQTHTHFRGNSVPIKDYKI